MSQSSIVVFARQQHPLEGESSRNHQPHVWRLLALGGAGLALGMVIGLLSGWLATRGSNATPEHWLSTTDSDLDASTSSQSAAAVNARAVPFARTGHYPLGPSQGGEGIRCNGTVSPGGTLKIEVATNDDSVSVSDSATGSVVDYPVGADKTVNVPVPPSPPGTVLVITVGRGPTRRTVLVEIVAPTA